MVVAGSLSTFLLCSAELKVQNKSLEGRVHELEDAVQSLSSAYNDFENVLAAKDAEITSLRNVKHPPFCFALKLSGCTVCRVLYHRGPCVVILCFHFYFYFYFFFFL